MPEEKLARVNITLTKGLLKRIDEYAKKRYEDRSTAMRQLMSIGIREGIKHEVTEAYKKGLLTIREASDLLATDYHTTQDILAEEGIPITDLTETETKNRKQKTKKDQY